MTTKLRKILGGAGKPPDRWEGAPAPYDDEELTVPSEVTRDSKNKIYKIAANASIAIADSTAWGLRYDEFTGLVHVDLAPGNGGRAPRPGELDDYHVTAAQHWLHCRGIETGTDATRQGIVHASKQNAGDSLKEYMLGLKWDGVARVETWARDYLAADLDVSQIMARKWMISGVARALDPGSQVDHMLVLVGGQAARKTSAMIELCPNPQWIQTDIPEPKDKDSMQLLNGVFIALMDEMHALSKRGLEEVVKSYITRRVDRYRPPYGITPKAFPRRCVFVGLSNPRQFLSDPTGNRRFWCMEVKKTDVDAIRRDRDQLWAEAVSLYHDGKPWWPEGGEAARFEAEADRYTESDPWESAVRSYCEFAPDGTVTISEILGSLGVETAKQSGADSRRITAILSANGWEQVGRIARMGKSVRAWKRKAEE